MGWSESERGCKKHAQYPPHDMMMMRQTISPSPGVCSSCLSERLSQLYAPSSTFCHSERIQTFASSHDQSNYSSASSSTSESPVNVKSQRGRHHHHQRTASDMNVKGSISFMIRSSTTAAGGGGGDHGWLMKKSRSVAVVSKSSSHHHFGEHHQVKKMSNGGKKKRGFWSKLLRTKEVFRHSKSSVR